MMGNQIKPDKPCQKCGSERAVTGEKFCKKCKKRVIADLKAEGYLDEVSRKTGIFSDERGRKGGVDIKVLGGTAELNSDGDNW